MQRLQSPTLKALVLVLVLAACGASLKLYALGITPSSDYQEYVATAQKFTGEDVHVELRRYLKPLNPLVVAGLGAFMDYESAFLLQALIFYFALVAATFFLAKEFFEDVWSASLVALLVALSYPVLRYGVDILTETGALFFYVSSLWLTMRFLKRPGWRVFIVNAMLVTLGFLWKEYSIVAAVIFGLAILSHAHLTVRDKVRYVATYAAIFLAVHIPWQLYVYQTYNYSYLSWYTEGVVGAAKQGVFTLHNIVKSTAALLGLAWLLVPLGFMQYRSLTEPQKRFLQISILPPFIGYFWGHIASRLIFVMAPQFLLVAVLGMRGWTRTTQVVFVALAIAANIAWLFLSYRISV